MSVLNQRVTNSLSYNRLGKTPVCLFPKRNACDDLNAKMLHQNSSEVRDIYCTDEIDETAGNRKMTKKVIVG